jgi:hypothetical protein
MGNDHRLPLKHTVDVPPMSRRVIEFEANEEKDWMFHCHILYHMMSGMARVFRYEDKADAPGHPGNASPAEIYSTPAKHTLLHAASLGEHSHDMSYLWGSASIQSHMSEGLLTWMNPKNDLMIAWEVGWQRAAAPQYEIDLLYQRYFNMNFQAFAGYRLTNENDAMNRGLLGFNYRLPLMAWANISLDTERDARFTLAKRLQFTPRLGAWGEVFYDTGSQWEWTAGADYTLTRSASFTVSYQSDYGVGAGMLFRF